ncbi:MAG: HlyC/CorC family transporter [Bacteroidetes bacterium]|nr:HlyC/CorC family transporter [Bacteroidota bacterium]MCW5896487.1 HlyC/CorC family transporter [Bacteroidota bacterium]
MEIVYGILKIASVFALVFLNGFFVAAEFAIVKVRMTQIEPLIKSGLKRARLAQQVITHLDAYLSATQLGITLTSLGLGWLGEPFVAHMLQPLFVLAGITNPTAVAAVSFGVAFSIITFLHIVLGELAPKSLAIQRAQKVTLGVAAPLHLFFVVFKPAIWLLNGTANYFLRAVGIEPVGESDLAHSEEELRILLSQGKTISTTSRSILLRAMELRDRTVREVMVPRTQIVYLSTDKSPDESLKIALESQFTRYPLCENDLDNVLGMIHLKDLFRMKAQQVGPSVPGGRGAQLLSIKRELLFVPETTPLEKMLNTFLTKRVLMAIVVDEYGGTAGLITLENVLEELVGEIRDEFDVEPLMVQKVNEGEYTIDGTMPLHDFARMFEVVPDTKDVVTVSGYVVHLLGRVPEKGATLRIDQWNGTIESVDKKKVKQLRIRKA